MLKQSLIYLILSILLVIFAKYAHLLIYYIDRFYAFIHIKLTPFFHYADLGQGTQKVFLLVLIPIAITAIPALSYRLIKGKDMPYLIPLTWAFWIVLVMSVILVPF